LLQADGAPSPVERTLIAPPRSRVGPLTDKERAIITSISPCAGKYEQAVDRESAEEILKARADTATQAATAAKARADAEKAAAVEAKEAAAQARETARLEREHRANPGLAEDMANQLGKSLKRQLVNRVAGQLIRGILGGLLRGR
jgi:DNA-directed RNA polymerase alpha subunit